MRHNIQDAYDAHDRAQHGPRPSWHPMLAAEERTPGVWVLVAQYGREYGTIRLIRRGNELGYRADNEAGELIGYYRTLRGACEVVHRRFLASHGPRARWPNNDEERIRALEG
jgi:hypothetical protein